MAAPDRYNIRVQCKGCKAIATIGVADHDNHAFSRRVDRDITGVSEGFTADMMGDSEFVIHCAACGTDTRNSESNISQRA